MKLSLLISNLHNKLAKKRRYWYSITILIYLIVFVLAYYLAFFIRSEFKLGRAEIASFCDSFGWVLGTKLLVFYWNGHFSNRWFYASVKELRMIIRSSLICLLLFVVINNFSVYSCFSYVNRSVFILDFGLTVLLVGGLRLGWRYYNEDVLPVFDRSLPVQKAFLIGANQQGGHVANLINSRRDSGYEIVGFLTIHAYKVRMQVGYIPILGHIDRLVETAKKHNVQNILIIAGLLPGSEFRKIYETCRENGLSLHVVPQNEIQMNAKIPIRDIDVNDLLKREPIKLDVTRIEKLVYARTVLVTGAGGSIGSEICRQLLAFKPKRLLLLGRGENRLFFLERELKRLACEVELIPIVANVANERRIDEVFRDWKPDVVFHAAAHKHVPLMELNVKEAVRNNIYGTKIVADAADRFGVEKFVLISTDKAVNPTSVMGTSKHLAERYVNAMAVHSRTKFIVTRFGNVLGSNGSVVPIFKEQIQSGGPITITDMRITRFFMTIPEAAQLVLEAAAMGDGGEIFVLDMGNPVKIVDLAKDMIRLAGLPLDSIEIKEVGLRPGEKLFEELYFDSETTLETKHPKLFAANHRKFAVEVVQKQIDELLRLLDGDSEAIRAKFKEFVPEYQPYRPSK